jgi:hypothetical protein
MNRQVLFFVTGAILISIVLGSCNTDVEGCTDPNGPNYNPDATVSNGDCGYPSQDKKVVCFYFNDSDNNTCGSFGLNLLDQVEATNPPNTYFITAHPNGTDVLFCPAGIDIATADSVGGFPDFGVGEQSGLLTQSAILNAITAEASETAQGGINVDYTITADSIVVTIYGKFYTNDPSTYFAVAYIFENNVVSPQVGASGSYNHKHVLRAASGPSGLGDQVNTLPISTTSSFKIRRGIYRNPIWNTSNILVVAVLWRQNGSDFEYINAGD